MWHRVRSVRLASLIAAGALVAAAIVGAFIRVHRSPQTCAAEDPPPTDGTVRLRLQAPARAGLPIWLCVDAPTPYVVRYPYGPWPWELGSNEVEFRRDGRPLPSAARPSPFGGGGNAYPLEGLVRRSGAPAEAARHRVPLHLAADLTEPGRYDVRWRIVSAARDSRGQRLAESEWLSFEVRPVSRSQREAALAELLANQPRSDRGLVGDFLPSLLAFASDARAADVFADLSYSRSSFVATYAASSLGHAPASVQVPSTLRAMTRRGPMTNLVRAVGNRAWFEDRRDELAVIATRSLTSADEQVILDGLRLLVALDAFDWPPDAPAWRDAAAAVEAAAPRLLRRGNDVATELVRLLAAMRPPRTRELLQALFEAQSSSARVHAKRVLDGLEPDWHQRALRPDATDAFALVGAQVEALLSASPAQRRAAAERLLGLANDSAVGSTHVAYLLDDRVIRRPRAVNADSWRDAAILIGRLHPSSRLAEGLLPYLARDGAVEGLIEIGEDAVPGLIDVLMVGGVARRAAAAKALGGIGGDAARRGLSDATATEHDDDVRNAIGEALSHLGQRRDVVEIR